MKNINNRLSLAFIAIAVLLLCLPASTAFAQRQSWDTSFIAEDTFFHAGLNVESVLALEPEDSELRIKVSKMVLDEMGIKVEELKQIQFLMGGEAVDDDEDVFQAKFLFTKEQDFEGVLEELFRGRYEVAKHDGKEFYLSTRGHGPSAYVPDNQTLVIANEVRLKKVMDNESGKGKIVDMLSEAEGNANVFIAFEYNDQLDEFVKEIAEEMRGLPFDFHDIASEAKRGHATVMLDSGEPLVATIEAQNADGAERLKRAVDALVSLGKIGIPQGREALKHVPDFGDEAAKEQMKEMMEQASKGLDTAEAALEGATVETDGATLEFKTKVMGGAVEGARALIRTVFFGMSMASAPRAAVEAIDAVDEVEVEVEEAKE